jgi:hypothetical protein
VNIRRFFGKVKPFPVSKESGKDLCLSASRGRGSALLYHWSPKPSSGSSQKHICFLFGCFFLENLFLAE